MDYLEEMLTLLLWKRVINQDGGLEVGFKNHSICRMIYCKGFCHFLFDVSLIPVSLLFAITSLYVIICVFQFHRIQDEQWSSFSNSPSRNFAYPFISFQLLHLVHHWEL